MNTPQLSVILPVFDVDRWLPECLDSIQAQTFTDWEAILVDDGSRDFSGIMCDSFSRRDPRFKVIHQENRGVSAARNAGIEASAAPLLSFVDPDDFVSVGFFQELISELRRVDADIAISAVNVTAEDGNTEAYKIVNKIYQLITVLPENTAMTNSQEVVNALCNGLISVSSWGKLFRRELWADTRFPTDTDLGEDVETVPAIVARANRAVCAPKAVYFYRQRRKSLSHGTVDYLRLQKNFKASSAMLDKLHSLSSENEDRFQWLKFRCDIDALMEYLRLNPKATKGKSRLYMLQKCAEETDSLDVVAAVIKRLVE